MGTGGAIDGNGSKLMKKDEKVDQGGGSFHIVEQKNLPQIPTCYLPPPPPEII